MFMLSDSIGFMLIENGMLYAQNPVYFNFALESEEGRRLYFIANLLRTVGRIAFPIFAFLISEGALHTRNMKNYILRLIFFAFLSEIPFDLATRGVIYYPDYQNILFTFALGALSVAIMEKAARLNVILKIPIIAFFCVVAYLIKSDYGPVGILMIQIFYLLKEDRAIMFILGVILAAVESMGYACVSALAFVFIYLYNGNRGEVPMKYLFYFVYPGHLLLFWVLRYFTNR